MNLPFRMVVILTSVGLLSGSLLTSIGLLTKEKIELNKQMEIQDAIIDVIPGTLSSKKLHEEKDFSVYGGKDKEGNFVGFAIHASGIGFQDKITFMLGTNTSLTRIKSLKILEQKETPGLGAKITDRRVFLQFWENKDCSDPLSLHKPAASSPEELTSSEINTITGATISSQAVLRIVNTSLERVRQLIKEGTIASEKEDVH